MTAFVRKRLLYRESSSHLPNRVGGKVLKHAWKQYLTECLDGMFNCVQVT